MAVVIQAVLFAFQYDGMVPASLPRKQRGLWDLPMVRSFSLWVPIELTVTSTVRRSLQCLKPLAWSSVVLEARVCSGRRR